MRGKNAAIYLFVVATLALTKLTNLSRQCFTFMLRHSLCFFPGFSQGFPVLQLNVSGRDSQLGAGDKPRHKAVRTWWPLPHPRWFGSLYVVRLHRIKQQGQTVPRPLFMRGQHKPRIRPHTHTGWEIHPLTHTHSGHKGLFIGSYFSGGIKIFRCNMNYITLVP